MFWKIVCWIIGHRWEDLDGPLPRRILLYYPGETIKRCKRCQVIERRMSLPMHINCRCDYRIPIKTFAQNSEWAAKELERLARESIEKERKGD